MASDSGTRLRLTGDGLLGNNYRLELNGIDISAQVTGVTVDLNVTEVNNAEIRYHCDLVEVDGEFKITHFCPLGESFDERQRA